MFHGLDDITPDMYESLNAEIEKTFDEGCHGDCGSCHSDCDTGTSKTPKVAKVCYAITGGKGGTGKSTVTALLALALTKRGLKVGVLDADISGATMPQLLGISGPVMNDDNQKMIPAKRDNLSVISFQLIAADNREPVIWPGADTANVASYFYTGTQWGDLDVLLLDMPAGGGDVPLNLYTLLPIDGVVLVTEPGALAAPAVQRCAALCSMLMSPPIALVENRALTETPSVMQHYQLPAGCLTLAVPLSADLAAHGEDGTLEQVIPPQLEPLVTWLAAQAAR